MKYFLYQAVDPDGKVVKGTLEAADSDALQNNLSARGLYLLEIKQTNNLFGALGKRLFSRNIKRADIIEFAANLSVMLQAGLPILTALEDLAVTCENATLHETIVKLKKDVEMGMRFSDALEAQGGSFPDIFIRLVRVGEETGGFEKSLADVADHLQKMEDLKGAIKRALIYPAFAIVTTFGALLFWLVFVLPKIVGTMQGMGVKLPLLTRVLIAASAFTQKYWLFIPLVPIVLVILNRLAQKNETACYYRDIIMLKLPIVKLITKNKLLALFSEQMRILIMSGLTIDKAFNLIADVIGNEVFRRAILDTRDKVMYGGLISEALKQHHVFPLLMIRMVNIGETSGTLESQFEFLSKHFREKLDHISENLAKILEPVVIGTVGLLFALIILGLMLPIYDLVSSMGKAN